MTEIEATEDAHVSPCDRFDKGQVVECRVIGFRDAKNHNFLPLTHLDKKHTVLECSLKAADLTKKRKKVWWPCSSLARPQSLFFFCLLTLFVSATPVVRHVSFKSL